LAIGRFDILCTASDVLVDVKLQLLGAGNFIAVQLLFCECISCEVIWKRLRQRDSTVRWIVYLVALVSMHGGTVIFEDAGW